jgi:hypothetical protein
MRRVASAVTVAALLVALGPWLALAQTPPAPDKQPGTFNWAQPLPDPAGVGVEVGTNTPGQDGGGDGGQGAPSPCGYVPVEDPEVVEVYQAQHPGQDGAVYLSVCTFDDGRARNFGVNWYPSLTPEELALQAVKQVRRQLPAVAVGFNPPGLQVVWKPTWLWVEPASWRPVTATASAPGVTASVTATPQRVTWAMGDGAQVVCDGPGTPYDSSQAGQEPACGHTYQQSSARQPGGAYPVTATVTYQVSWEAVGAPGGGPLPPITSINEFPLQVTEVQALN